VGCSRRPAVGEILRGRKLEMGTPRPAGIVMRGFTSPSATCLMLTLLLVIGGVSAVPAVAISCGVWRWDVKTLSDHARKDVSLNPQAIRINALRKKDPPSTLSTDTPRQNGIEKQVYRVGAQVITATIEDDSDIHLVIAPRGNQNKTMIVEFPQPRCVDSAFKRPEIRHARAAMLDACGPISSSSFTDLSGKVVIEGVGFWDELHGQTGVAPNGVELHPVLGFSGNCSKA
jgi:hypothetical protein